MSSRWLLAWTKESTITINNNKHYRLGISTLSDEKSSGREPLKHWIKGSLVILYTIIFQTEISELCMILYQNFRKYTLSPGSHFINIILPLKISQNYLLKMIECVKFNKGAHVSRFLGHYFLISKNRKKKPWHLLWFTCLGPKRNQGTYNRN